METRRAGYSSSAPPQLQGEQGLQPRLKRREPTEGGPARGRGQTGAGPAWGRGGRGVSLGVGGPARGRGQPGAEPYNQVDVLEAPVGSCGGTGGEAGVLLGISWTEMAGPLGENKSDPAGVLEALFGARIILWVRKADRSAPSGTLILEGQGEQSCRESPQARRGWMRSQPTSDCCRLPSPRPALLTLGPITLCGGVLGSGGPSGIPGPHSLDARHTPPKS